MGNTALLSRKTTHSSTPDELGSILIIDDELEIRESLQTLLELENYKAEGADCAESGLALLESTPYDLVLLDIGLPDRNGLEVLEEIRERDPNLPVIVITAHGTVNNAIRAMQVGASNFVAKPWDNEKLLADVGAAVARRRAEEENQQLKRALKQRYNFENIIGKSDIMLRVFDLVAQVAPSRYHSYPWRKRHRQGAHRQSGACEFSAQGSAVCSRQYRLDAAGFARINPLWPREGRIHFGNRFQEGTVRGSRPWHAFP